MQASLDSHSMAACDSTGWASHAEVGKLRLLATLADDNYSGRLAATQLDLQSALPMA